MPTGTRSRSPSRSRSRSRSRSYDSRDDYSDYTDDDFYTDDSRVATGKTAKTKKPAPGKPPAGRGKPPPKQGKPGQKGKAPVPAAKDYVTSRVLSARRLKINELKNENEELRGQLGEVSRENKLLTRTATMQDRKLLLYEDTESDMPRIIAKHQEETRANREQIRKQKEKNAKAEAKLKEVEEELSRTQRLLRKMKGLVEDKQLDERDVLARKLTRIEADSEDKDKRVKDLEKHVELLQKNHKHELGIERARFREAQKEASQLREQVTQLQTDVKDVRRDLEINNIYANRALKAGRSSTRASALSSPAPSRHKNHERKNSEPTGMTPRDKAKAFEAQRRDQERQNREERRLRRKLNEERTSRLSEEPAPETRYQPEVRESRRMGEPEDQPAAESDWFQASLKKKREEEAARDRQREEEEEQLAWQQDRDRRKKEADDRERNRQERLREEHEQRQREDRELREREDRDREERERREHEDRERREREEVERRAREERERMANDERLKEQQRQKASLLAKMKALETGNKATDAVIMNDPFAPAPRRQPQQDEIFDDPFAVPSSRKAETKTYVVDESRGRNKAAAQGSPVRRRGSSNQYSFGKPIENLHNGMPSHDNVTVPVLERHKRRNSLFDEDSDGGSGGGYQPTFTSNKASAGRRAAPAPANKDSKPKKDLMNDLFGGSSTNNNTTAPKRNTDDDDIFGESKKASSGQGRRRGEEVDVFGGEDPPKNNSHLLPRRARQPTTTFNSPAINSVDTFDDDIEEVML